jgi:hypothetical protein
MSRWSLTGLFGQVLHDNRSGRAYAITMLTPIEPGHGPQLREVLRAFDQADSPFASLRAVHFGRWVVIDDLKTCWAGAPVPPPTLNSRYLLFTACVTAPDANTFLAELVAGIPDVVDEVWTHCLNYPEGGVTNSETAVLSYLSRGLIDTSLFYAGYPNASPGEVCSALDGHAQFVNFVREHQGDQDPAALQLAYLEESPTWFP